MTFFRILEFFWIILEASILNEFVYINCLPHYQGKEQCRNLLLTSLHSSEVSFLEGSTSSCPQSLADQIDLIWK